MRVLAVVLAVLILLVQIPLWFGKGGWLRVWEGERQLAEQVEKNRTLSRRNAALAAEVRDLKQGFDAVEERARFELGLVKPDEVFFQIVEPGAAGAPPAPVPLPAKKPTSAKR
ncbi:MAG: cell division protein FtsB [Proteobacteria bacterium]|nr:cell division protein FtsB [Pseudomonadota bacterium]